MERQACLNQREEHVFGRLEELAQYEKQLEIVKQKLEVEQTLLKEEKSNFALDVRTLATREEVWYCPEYVSSLTYGVILLITNLHAILLNTCSLSLRERACSTRSRRSCSFCKKSLRAGNM